jgi:hypothetical protein
MSLGWTTVYRLQNDAEQVRVWQNASLHKPGFGLAITDGLIGSDDWWHRVETGELAANTLEGIITRLSMGPMGDYPLCYVTADDGDISEWTRLAVTPLYAVGNRIEVDYVVQFLKPAVVERWKGRPDQKIVMEIRIMPGNVARPAT